MVIIAIGRENQDDGRLQRHGSTQCRFSIWGEQKWAFTATIGELAAKLQWATGEYAAWI